MRTQFHALRPLTSINTFHWCMALQPRGCFAEAKIWQFELTLFDPLEAQASATRFPAERVKKVPSPVQKDLRALEGALRCSVSNKYLFQGSSAPASGARWPSMLVACAILRSVAPKAPHRSLRASPLHLSCACPLLPVWEQKRSILRRAPTASILARRKPKCRIGKYSARRLPDCVRTTTRTVFTSCQVSLAASTTSTYL